jgi:RimJ/RimL family protein N-acetyltransferase
MLNLCLWAGGVYLVPYDETHDAQTVIWLNESELKNKFGLVRIVTLDGHREWIKLQKDLYLWSILDEEKIHQGNISIRINERHFSGYLQIYIGNSAARGKGLGSTALRLVVDYFFEILRFHRLWLHTFPDNHVAKGIYSRMGFEIEGIEKESLFKEGRFYDQYRWSLLGSRWEEKIKESSP